MLLKTTLNWVSVWVSVCVCVCVLPKGATGGHWNPRAGVTVSCEPPDRDAGTRTWVPWKGSAYSYLLSHFCSPVLALGTQPHSPLPYFLPLSPTLLFQELDTDTLLCWSEYDDLWKSVCLFLLNQVCSKPTDRHCPMVSHVIQSVLMAADNPLLTSAVFCSKCITIVRWNVFMFAN